MDKRKKGSDVCASFMELLCQVSNKKLLTSGLPAFAPTASVNIPTLKSLPVNAQTR